MSWLFGARTRLRLLFAPRAAESRMNEEVAFHIEMESARLAKEELLSPADARRRALATFGGVTRYKEELRVGRGLTWLGGMSLDLKLGFRMLVKYPWLTIVGGLAMASAIWVGAVTFELVRLVGYPALPLPEGDRIVHLYNWDAAASSKEPRALHDFSIWRGALKSVTDLGAYRDVSLNLITDGGNDARPVAAAEITASAFRIAPALPRLGRVLMESDERVGAPAVVVLGYEVWRTRFASDLNVVGKSVRLGDTYATVVGVMPERFAFPVSHELWTPLRVDAFDRAPRNGPSIYVFGRLAERVSLKTAQTELSALGLRSATELPNTHEHLRPRVAPYATLIWDPSASDDKLIYSFNIFAMMLVVLLSSNVALLLFARAATRENELMVRSALGASRRRIVLQLFAEALVLGSVAAAVGLGGTAFTLHRWGRSYLETTMGTLPFWYDVHLSPMTVVYAIGLTVLGAAIAGVMPALKVTHGLGAKLRQTAGGGGLRFGGVWTGVIVAQVALTVAFPALVLVEQRQAIRIRQFDAGFATEKYLAVQLDMEQPNELREASDTTARGAKRARFAAALEGMRRRVAEEPSVEGVTFVDRLPRMPHTERAVELDEPKNVGAPPTGATAAMGLREASLAWIDPSYFDVVGAPILAGRAFHAGDAGSEARVVIVDQGFVDQVLRGRNAIGMRVRIADARSFERPVDSYPWYEIVGVVKELGMGSPMQRGRAAGLYLATSTDSASTLNMIVHVRGDPLSLLPRVRAIAATVDPMLRLSDPQRLNEVTNGVMWFIGLWLRITVMLTSIALLLSLAGIYAVLSFTVTRRTREIGVRVALGANRRRVVAAIFRRPLAQVGFGVLTGGLLIAIAAFVVIDGGLTLAQIALLVAYATLMLGVCLIACVVPTRRALSVEPTVALRAE